MKKKEEIENNVFHQVQDWDLDTYGDGNYGIYDLTEIGHWYVKSSNKWVRLFKFYVNDEEMYGTFQEGYGTHSNPKVTLHSKEWSMSRANSKHPDIWKHHTSGNVHCNVNDLM